MESLPDPNTFSTGKGSVLCRHPVFDSFECDLGGHDVQHHPRSEEAWPFRAVLRPDLSASYSPLWTSRSAKLLLLQEAA